MIPFGLNPTALTSRTWMEMTTWTLSTSFHSVASSGPRTSMGSFLLGPRMTMSRWLFRIVSESLMVGWDIERRAGNYELSNETREAI